MINELFNCSKQKGYRTEELRELVGNTVNWSNLESNLDKIKIKLKVDWIYDQKREMSFTRIFGIGLYDTTMKDDKPICWLWYTDVRNWLNRLNNLNLIKEINDLHELRFDIKCSKIKSIASIEEIIPQDAKSQKELLFDLFDIEHVFWFDKDGHFSFGNRRFKRLYVLH